MSVWNECPSCQEEFQVVGGSLGSKVDFCCFCGDVVNSEDDELEEEFEEDE